MAHAEPVRHLCLLGDATSPHIQRWAHEMRVRDYRVSLITARPAHLPGVELHVLAPVSRSAQWLARVRQTRRYLDALAPDLVHAHYVTSYGYLAARCGRHPLVMTAWGSDLLMTPNRNPWMRWLTGFTLRRADLITADSVSLVEAASAWVPRDRTQLLHWGVDLHRFTPAPWASKPPLHVVSLRAWEPLYNIDVILQAVARLRASGTAPDVHLHLLGGGSQEAMLRTLAHDLGLTSDHITFHGRLDDAGMARVMAACKIAVSVPSSDGTSVALLESMACGLAVVASDLPANAQWLESRCLVNARDPVQIATCIGEWIHDEPALQAVANRNAERMRREGDRQVQMDRMHALYQQLLRQAALEVE